MSIRSATRTSSTALQNFWGKLGSTHTFINVSKRSVFDARVHLSGYFTLGLIVPARNVELSFHIYSSVTVPAVCLCLTHSRLHELTWVKRQTNVNPYNIGHHRPQRRETNALDFRGERPFGYQALAPFHIFEYYFLAS